MSDRFEDERGVIQDLLGQVDSVTFITTKKGAIRGNHVHRETDQWTFVISGRLFSVQGDDKRRSVGKGTGLRMIFEPKGVPHAWRAMEDTECLVFTKGPRAGENYEEDTYRLDEPLLT